MKQKKMSLEQFVIKFNIEDWMIGIKTLFNLNLVGLDSDEEIVDILLNLKGIKKENIDKLLFCEKKPELAKIFFRNLLDRSENDPLKAVLDLHHYIPLRNSSFILEISSIGVKKYIEHT